jgi:hypothetical protein
LPPLRGADVLSSLPLVRRVHSGDHATPGVNAGDTLNVTPPRIHSDLEGIVVHRRGISIDAAGNSYVAGEFSGIVTVGFGEINETLLTAANRDLLIAKSEMETSKPPVTWAFPALPTAMPWPWSSSTPGACLTHCRAPSMSYVVTNTSL